MRYTPVLLTALALAACGTAASSSGSGLSADAELDGVLAGHPDSLQTQEGDAVTAALTTAEMDHLVHVDWSKATSAALLNDGVVLKAMAAVEPIGGSVIHAQSMNATVTPTDIGGGKSHTQNVYTCDANCQQCQDELDVAITALQGKLAKHTVGGAATCLALAPTLAGGLMCAAIIAYILNQEVLALGDLTLCKAGIGGGSLTQDYGTPGSVTALNSSCGLGVCPDVSKLPIAPCHDTNGNWTFTGGAISDGVYLLTADTFYNGDGTVVASDCVNHQTMPVTLTFLTMASQQYMRRDTGAGCGGSAEPISLSDSKISYVDVPYPAPFPMQYTASSDGTTLYLEQGSVQPLSPPATFYMVATYVKQ